MRAPSSFIIAAVLAATAAAGAQSQEGFRFRSGVDLVNVTATVTDEDGRFVSGLRREDFTVYEDGKLQDVSHFSNDRVPVSLGLLLDTSGSMSAEKMAAARTAIDRLIYDLLGKDDELFLVEFATNARLTQGWTTDRRLISRGVREASAAGGRRSTTPWPQPFQPRKRVPIGRRPCWSSPTATTRTARRRWAPCDSRFVKATSSSMPWASTAPDVAAAM